MRRLGGALGGGDLSQLARNEIHLPKKQIDFITAAESAVKPAHSKGGEDPIMYVSRMDAVLNSWFTNYEEARASLDSEGGYLLPYKSQFFVTQSEGIRELGLDPEDPDWARIGWDWLRPQDNEAWERLKQKRRLAM